MSRWYDFLAGNQRYGGKQKILAGNQRYENKDMAGKRIWRETKDMAGNITRAHARDGREEGSDHTRP